MTALEHFALDSWNTQITPLAQEQAIEALENGKIILLPHLNFAINDNEKHLLSAHYVPSKAKPISYDAHTTRLIGARCNAIDAVLLQELCARYANHAKQLIHHLFPYYRPALQTGRTCYRPAELLGYREKSFKKDHTRLHIDTFAATPTQGRRILRIYTNINPFFRDRVWRVGQSFSTIAERYLSQVPNYHTSLAKILYSCKVTKSLRTQYDHIMLHIHNAMKKDVSYQATVAYQEINFKPHSSWITFSDQVSHAALSGQFELEQTFYLPPHAMHEQAKSPLNILEGMLGRSLI